MFDTNSKRKKSSSVTELIKIIAQEIFENNVSTIHHIVNSIIDERKDCDISNAIKKADLAGAAWNNEEDKMFDNEINQAIIYIAKRHKRTPGAIRSRLQQRFKDNL